MFGGLLLAACVASCAQPAMQVGSTTQPAVQVGSTTQPFAILTNPVSVNFPDMAVSAAIVAGAIMLGLIIHVVTAHYLTARRDARKGKKARK